MMKLIPFQVTILDMLLFLFDLDWPFTIFGCGYGRNKFIGAIDDVAAIVGIAHKYSAWVHVDAVCGGLFMVTTYGSKKLEGILNKLTF